MKCSCPDYAGMCKHIAAVLYGVGATLDAKPEWLFNLRHVDHVDLITVVGSSETLIQTHGDASSIDDDELSALFDIEMDSGKTTPKPKKATAKKARVGQAKAKPAKKSPKKAKK